MLKNFSSLKAIISALQSNPIYRLKHIWANIPKEKVWMFYCYYSIDYIAALPFFIRLKCMKNWPEFSVKKIINQPKENF